MEIKYTVYMTGNLDLKRMFYFKTRKNPYTLCSTVSVSPALDFCFLVRLCSCYLFPQVLAANVMVSNTPWESQLHRREGQSHPSHAAPAAVTHAAIAAQADLASATCNYYLCLS